MLSPLMQHHLNAALNKHSKIFPDLSTVISSFVQSEQACIPCNPPFYPKQNCIRKLAVKGNRVHSKEKKIRRNNKLEGLYLILLSSIIFGSCCASLGLQPTCEIVLFHIIPYVNVTGSFLAEGVISAWAEKNKPGSSIDHHEGSEANRMHFKHLNIQFSRAEPV